MDNRPLPGTRRRVSFTESSLLASAVLSAVLLCTAKLQPSAAAPPAAPGLTTHNDAFDGTCKGCHGVGAAGGFGPRLAGISLSEAEFTKIVRGGRGRMPALDTDRIADPDLDSVYKWLTSFKPAKPTPGLPHQQVPTVKPSRHPAPSPAGTRGTGPAGGAGASLSATAYPSHCAACHGPAAAGAFGPRLAGFRLTLEDFQKILRQGRGNMPAFSVDRLPDVDLAELYSALHSGAAPGPGHGAAGGLGLLTGPGGTRPVSAQGGGSQPAGASIVAPTGPVSGQAFVANCSSCHGPAGMGGVGPRLSGLNISATEFQGIVRRGQGMMPSFTQTALPDATLETIARFLKIPVPALVAGAGSANSLIAIGSRIFSASCARCHGPAGMGALGPRLAAAPVTLDDIEITRKGKGAMPAFSQAALSDIDLAAVYFFLEHSQTPQPKPQVPSAESASNEAPAAPAITPTFSAWCASCHGPAATGAFGPPLVHIRLPLPTFVNIVRTGKRRMPAFPHTSVSDAELAAIYSALERATPAEGTIPLSYRISAFLTVDRVLQGLLVLLAASLLLAVRVVIQWVARAGRWRAGGPVAKLGFGRACGVGIKGAVVDGFLAAGLYRRNKAKWLGHEALLYGLPLVALAVVILGAYDTARTYLSWSDPLVVVPAALALAILIAAVFVRQRYTGRRDFATDAQFGLDYLFIDLLILAIVAGFLACGARRFGDVSWVQPTRLFHLGLVAVLLLSAPWTSFAHAFVVPILAGFVRVREAMGGGKIIPQEMGSTGQPQLSSVVLEGLDPDLRLNVRNAVNAVSTVRPTEKA